MSDADKEEFKDTDCRDEDAVAVVPATTIEILPLPSISMCADGNAIPRSGAAVTGTLNERPHHEQEPDHSETSTRMINPALLKEKALALIVSSTGVGEEATTISSQQTSKNQLKKRRRMEKAIEIKQRKKEQKKQVRYERAKAQGRDIDAERIQQEEARIQSATNVNRIKRIREWQQEMLPKIRQSYQICIDCSFESYMTPKEINSLAIQIRYCYSSNKRSTHPCQLTATSIGTASSNRGKDDCTNTDDNATNRNIKDVTDNNCITLNHLRKVNGFDEWSNYAFQVTSDSFDQYFHNNLQNMVYLTSDSENTIATLENDKIYVIGGIVDRNRYKQLTYQRATTLGMATAKLPIDEYLSTMPSTRVLTTNHVFDLLIKYKEHNGCWKKALAEVLPIRKDAKFAEESNLEVDEDEH